MKICILLLCLTVLSTVSAERLLSSGSNLHDMMVKNCKNWDSAQEVCLECYQGCIKWQNICVKIVKHCAQWDEKGNCIECQDGYGSTSLMSINGTCPEQPPRPQPTPNQTVGSPPDNQPTASPFTGNETDSNTTQFDTNCQCHSDDRTCIDCFAGYYLDMDAICQVLPQNCTVADPSGLCTSCIAGWKVQNGTCIEQQCNLGLCATFNEDQTQCTACPFRSYLVEGCCIEVDGLCSQWVEDTGVCTQCYAGYVIDKNDDKACVIGTA